MFSRPAEVGGRREEDVLREQMGLPVASPGGHEGAELLAEAKKLEAPGASGAETPPP